MSIIEVTDLLNRLVFALETVAHLRGMELELLPLCGEARDMIITLSVPQKPIVRTMGELMDEYEVELVEAVNRETP